MTLHRHLAVASIMALGCASTAPAARPIAPPPAAPVVDASVAASDVPPPAPRFDGATVLFEVPWPQRDAPAMRFAVVTTAPGPNPSITTVAWEPSPGHDEVSVSTPFPEGARPLRVEVLDVTGDGASDAVVWFDPATLPTEQPAHSTVVFTRGDSRREPTRATWTSLALGVVADEAALRAAASTARAFVTPENAPSLDAVMLRLGFATPAQFRSLVAPRGLTLCDSAAGNAHPHYHRCRTYPAAAITDALYADRIRATITLFEAPHDPDDSPLVDSAERCRAVRNDVVCGVPTGGPASTVVVFTGPAAARRIARVETTVYEDS